MIIATHSQVFHMTAIPIADKMEVGALGVVYLKRLWSFWVSGLQCASEDRISHWRAMKVLFSGLGLGVEDTLGHVGQTHPSFEAFEAWVLSRNGGTMDPKVVARINAALIGAAPPAEAMAHAQAIEQAPPVLSGEDLAHWAEHGWVVLHDAISPDACRVTAQAVWNVQRMSPANPAGWERMGPNQQCVFVQLFRHPALDANRRSARIHKAFAQLWGIADLWVTTDRVGFNPPVTQQCPFPGPGIHWDVSLVQPIPLGIQGLIYLTDTAADQGAFALVPGMHRTIGPWLDSVPPGVSPHVHAAKTLEMTPIAGRAGDMILWHHALPHGPTPNTSDQPRLVQYMKMFPADFGYQPDWL
ncbi:MAG: phytanoyl-CoA dioxygenase family protein [Rhodospirillaceae bacterium]|nr:phytanoyl-CoA dioxygenase family protein [Rhodospirillales bacterium]